MRALDPEVGDVVWAGTPISLDAMAQHRAAIFEEQVVGDLVADLRRTR